MLLDREFVEFWNDFLESKELNWYLECTYKEGEIYLVNGEDWYPFPNNQENETMLRRKQLPSEITEKLIEE